MKIIYIILGFFFFALGALGAVLPVLPTTPFLLAAAFFFAKGSDRFYQWFICTTIYKKYLKSFAEKREMELKVKIGLLAFASTALAFPFYLTDSTLLRVVLGLLVIFKYYYFIFRVKTKKKETKKPSAKKLLQLAEQSKKYIGLTILFYWINLLCNITIVFLISFTFQMIQEAHFSSHQLYPFLGITAGAILLRFLCSYLASMYSHRAASNAKKELRIKIYDKALSLGTKYQEKVEPSALVQMAVEGVEQLQIYFGSYLPQLVYSILAPVTLFFFFSFFSVKIALALLLCVPLIPLLIIVIQRYAKKITRRYWNNYSDLGSTFLENLYGLTTLKIYEADQKRHEEMNTQAEGFRKMTMKVLTMQLNSITVMDLVAYGGAAAGILIALFEYTNGSLPLWGVICILLLSSEFFIPLRMLGSLFHISMNGIAAAEKIFSVLELPEEEEKTEKPEGFSFELKETSFSYGREKSILEGISLSVPEGDFISIVGVSGSGKSTLASILAGEKHEYQGNVLLGGKELREINRESIRSQVTVVEHSEYLFKGTVAQNLLMGKPCASITEMENALKKVRLYDFVISQGGLSMLVNEQGSNLSGGQRQRLCLARALLRDSNVYIFDEATSNIDAESEASIMEVILSLSKEKTVIFISHRLESARKAHRICFLENGRICEIGTHAEVYAKNANYASLYDSQQRTESYVRGELVYG